MLSVFGDSQRTLHDTFMQTYGHLYEKNSDLFEDFFKELRRYYERGNDNLFEITNKLFSKLYQRMFQVSSYVFIRTIMLIKIILYTKAYLVLKFIVTSIKNIRYEKQKIYKMYRVVEKISKYQKNFVK